MKHEKMMKIKNGYVQNQRAAAFERLRPALADFHFQSLEAQPESRSEKAPRTY